MIRIFGAMVANMPYSTVRNASPASVGSSISTVTLGHEEELLLELDESLKLDELLLELDGLLLEELEVEELLLELLGEELEEELLDGEELDEDEGVGGMELPEELLELDELLEDELDEELLDGAELDEELLGGLLEEVPPLPPPPFPPLPPPPELVGQPLELEELLLEEDSSGREELLEELNDIAFTPLSWLARRSFVASAKECDPCRVVGVVHSAGLILGDKQSR